MDKKKMRRYASLIARKGINVQKGQEVIIGSALNEIDFIRILQEECYKAGAGKVTVEWTDQRLLKNDIKYQDRETLARVSPWQRTRLKERVETLPATIRIASEDPMGMKGIDQAKYSHAMARRARAIKKYADAMDNKNQWCIAAVPGPEWAERVFPGIPKREAVKKLWDAILYTSRADGEDPVEDWNRHNAFLLERCERLNAMGLKSLHYNSSNGTDFTVGLIEKGLFLGGSDVTLSGIEYDPNIPTEEVFTAPDRMTANGKLVATKPLSYRGELIEDFSITFRDGKAVEVHAGKNEELLRQMIATDRGAAYLGECALVPFDSPISRSGILFYNTLFDENASCHFALGRAYTNCIEDFEKYSSEELAEKGFNDSVIHVDFMVGSDDLTIDGIDRDGNTVPIFREGNWAF